MMKHNLYIAYAAAWIIHGGYLAYLAHRFTALKRRMAQQVSESR